MNTNDAPTPSSPIPAEASDPVAGRCALGDGSAPAPQEQEKRVRLSLDVSKRFKDTLEALSKRLDHGSLTETIRHAVYAFDKRSEPFDVDMALALSSYVHAEWPDAPHDIGIHLAMIAAQHSSPNIPDHQRAASAPKSTDEKSK